MKHTVIEDEITNLKSDSEHNRPTSYIVLAMKASIPIQMEAGVPIQNAVQHESISPKHCDETGTSANYTLKISCVATFKHLPCNCKLPTIMCSHLEHCDDPDPHLLKHKWQVHIWHFWDVRIAVLGWINKPNTCWDCHPWSRFWSPEGGLTNGWPLGQAPDVELFLKSLRLN